MTKTFIFSVLSVALLMVGCNSNPSKSNNKTMASWYDKPMPIEKVKQLSPKERTNYLKDRVYLYKGEKDLEHLRSAFETVVPEDGFELVNFLAGIDKNNMYRVNGDSYEVWGKCRYEYTTDTHYACRYTLESEEVINAIGWKYFKKYQKKSAQTLLNLAAKGDYQACGMFLKMYASSPNPFEGSFLSWADVNGHATKRGTRVAFHGSSEIRIKLPLEVAQGCQDIKDPANGLSKRPSWGGMKASTENYFKQLNTTVAKYKSINIQKEFDTWKSEKIKLAKSYRSKLVKNGMTSIQLTQNALLTFRRLSSTSKYDLGTNEPFLEYAKGELAFGHDKRVNYVFSVIQADKEHNNVINNGIITPELTPLAFVLIAEDILGI